MATDDIQNDHFKNFATSLEKEIQKYGEFDGDFYHRQKAQVEKLVALENEFRKTLIRHRWGAGVYRDFIVFICDTRKNILAARPFFRERQEIFTKEISKALKKRSDKTLYKFHFNYQFILFVMSARNWRGNRMGAKIVKLYEEIAQIRTELIEMNMPLAINRARLFWSRTPKSHLTYMDFIQIASEGLMSAVDKFVPPFTKVFRSVAIGRMVGNFIEEYSETLVHFYPSDKRKIYRANKLVGKHANGVDYVVLADAVNDKVKPAHKTNASEIADLMAAASCVSADSSVSSETDYPERISRFSAPESDRPDIQIEYNDAIKHVNSALGTLSIFESKFLKLKGIAL